jgi:hypothetical protein
MVYPAPKLASGWYTLIQRAAANIQGQFQLRVPAVVIAAFDSSALDTSADYLVNVSGKVTLSFLEIGVLQD